MYKPDPRLSGIARHSGMMQRRADVLQALKAFEERLNRSFLPAELAGSERQVRENRI